MSIKKNNSKKIGLIASTIIHLIVFILLTLPFMSLTYLDPPKQRTGGISINFGESEDFSQSNVDDEKQKQSNNTNQKKSDSSKNNTNSENNKNSNKKTNGPKDLALDDNSSNPSVDKSKYDDFFKNAKEREKNSNTNPDLNQFPEKESKGSKSNIKQGDITVKTGPIRSVIEPVSPSGGTKAGKIHVTIYVNSNGTVVAADINIDKENISDPIMQDECKKAALDTKFEPSNEIEDLQIAEIVYSFKFKKL